MTTMLRVVSLQLMQTCNKHPAYIIAYICAIACSHTYYPIIVVSVTHKCYTSTTKDDWF